MMFRPDIDNIEWAIRRSSDHSRGLRAWIDDINDLIEYIRHLEAQRAELLPWALAGCRSIDDDVSFARYHPGGDAVVEWPFDDSYHRPIDTMLERIEAGEFGEVQS